MIRLCGWDGLLPHALWVADDLVRGALDDASGSGELRADAHEEDVNVSGCRTTFVNAPGNY